MILLDLSGKKIIFEPCTTTKELLYNEATKCGNPSNFCFYG
ncbi:MAG: hypothetical protein ACJAU0_000108 [Flavobacteriales bacterium]|jgi:hypothetical protein